MFARNSDEENGKNWSSSRWITHFPASIVGSEFHVPGYEIEAVRHDHYRTPGRSGLLFSRAGFDVSEDGRTIAALTVSMNEGGFMCGVVLLLEKDAAGWRIAERRSTWIT